MFQRTLLKLTAINSAVFLVIFAVFGATLYGYVSQKLFDKVDDAMRLRAEAFRMVNGRADWQMNRPGKHQFFDPRILLLLRDTEGNIINLFPLPPLVELGDLSSLVEDVKPGVLQTLKTSEHYYRVLDVPYADMNASLVIPGMGVRSIKEVVVLSIVDSEQQMLFRLFGIIVVGLIIGMVVIVGAGFFLARHALIPIRAAWDKQQQFVADASHELRTPLAVIKTNAELMLRHPQSTVEEESKRIANVLRESSRMNRLVNSLLTLARADANQEELHFTPLNLQKILQDIVEQFRPLADMKKIVLELEAGEVPDVMGDKERIHQLLVILLDNAIKYTPEQGCISLFCRRVANNIQLEVSDTGIGMAAEDLPRVFDRFYRSDKVRSREEGGTGLGLAIAKWIVEKHGGRIRVESKLSAGARFIISFPLRKS
jgi:signal transduction histidine kinase